MINIKCIHKPSFFAFGESNQLVDLAIDALRLDPRGVERSWILSIDRNSALLWLEVDDGEVLAFT